MRIGFELEGAFQAWGVPSEFNIRNVSYQPTKRGVVGLIGCCMGIPRGDSRLEHLLSVLKIEVETKTRENGKKKTGSMMIDYQTISKSDGTKLNAANGGVGEKTTDILKKGYLNDAAFLVHVECEDKELMKKIYDSLVDPVWVPYLGRKNCLPTEPIIPYFEEQ